MNNKDFVDFNFLIDLITNNKPGIWMIDTLDVFVQLLISNKYFSDYLVKHNMDVYSFRQEYEDLKSSNTNIGSSCQVSFSNELSIIMDSLDYRDGFNRPTFDDFMESILEIDEQTTRILMEYNFVMVSLTEEDFEFSTQVETSKEHMNKILQYCDNLNEFYKQGNIDPVIGRKREIERACVVLSRKTIATPLFVGDAGVGKTAIADGIAQKIVNGEVPDNCLNNIIFSTSVNRLLRNCMYRGQFEEKIEALLESLKRYKEQTGYQPVLFIDEIHSIMGAGSSSSNDMSNMLKPYLAKGIIKLMGCTTEEEYNKHISKDKALSRRFKKIVVSEPSLKETKEILMGLKKRYEEFHQVVFSKENVDYIVDLSKHIFNRRNPDKSIDILDDALALAKTKKEHKISKEYIDYAFQEISGMSINSVVQKENFDNTKLDKFIKNSIFGQDEAIAEVVSILKISEAGLGRDNSPRGTFLLAGPTGVGKTELAKQVKEFYKRPLLRIDLAEYDSKHEVSKLIGAPPGYAGHENGGLLTNYVTKNPDCVIIFDEVEKAHPDILNNLLQICQEGELRSGLNELVDFRKTIIFLTTNLGVLDGKKRSMSLTSEPIAKNSMHFDKDKCLISVKSHFKDEIIGRLNKVIVFNQITKEAVFDIIKKETDVIKQKSQAKGCDVIFDKKFMEHIFDTGFDLKYGARNIKSTIEQIVLPLLADILLEGKKKEVKISFKEGKCIIK